MTHKVSLFHVEIIDRSRSTSGLMQISPFAEAAPGSTLVTKEAAEEAASRCGQRTRRNFLSFFSLRRPAVDFRPMTGSRTNH